jgi:hypothetical protein
MNEQVIRAKHAEILAGRTAVMSGAELDWLIDNDMHPKDVVSIPNPEQVGTLDVYLVGKSSCPPMQAELEKHKTLTSATRASLAVNGIWDEPADAASPRGWYWPKGSTQPGKTLCAGHYLDYGAGHRRFDDLQRSQPGNIHCVVFTKSTGRCAASGYVETVEAARTWIQSEAAKAGHSIT